MSNKHQIFRMFVSSTYVDLIAYRKAAEKAINDLGQKYDGMEYLGAMDKEPVRACLDLVEDCDLFIGVYAWRYGYIPDKTDISITQQEYNHAKTCGKPCLCYFVDEDFAWLPKFIESGTAADKLKQFKSAISKEHVRDSFKEPLHLEKNIIRDVSRWLADNRPGLGRETVKPGENPLVLYKAAIAAQYSTLVLIGFNRSFDMDSIYIPLTVHIDRESHMICKPDKAGEKLYDRRLTAQELTGLPDRVIVVLGEPGMGKTTMLRYLALKESKKSDGLLPIFVKLADFSKTREPLASFLHTCVESYFTGSAMKEAVQTAIDKQQALILLDGLDEVSRSEYNNVTDRIRAFICGRQDCRVIITSRKAGFQSHEVPYTVFEIDKLLPAEIETFVTKWFKEKNDLSLRIRINPRIHELSQNPFLLSIICLIFEKDHNLPERRVELYKICAVKLLTLYDEKQLPKVNSFTRLIKEQVLADLAYHFFCKETDEFPYEPLIEQVTKTLTVLQKQHNEEEVLREIRENSGLLQKSSDNHLFVHRTFYEYYVSCKMQGSQEDEILSRAGAPRWEEAIRLYAAQIKTAAEGTQFFTKLWNKERSLALRCYPDMDRVVEPELIKRLLNEATVEERVELVKGLPGKIEDAKIVETLRELFRHETNGEVIYWSVQILDEIKETPGALAIVTAKLDKGAAERYKKYIQPDMVLIPAGEFKMGSPESEAERSSNETLHSVKVNAFYLNRYQVTNQLYEQFDPEHKKQRNKYSDQDNQPVVNINWYEAVVYSRWLGCRLPTEAQWEYACRAGTTTPFNTGENLTTEQANYDGDNPYKNNPKGKYLGKTMPVGNYPANSWGLFDMHGNVWEWCMDWYGDNYYNEYKKHGITEKPQGPENGSRRVVRGGSWGSWGSFAQYCRSAYRGSFGPGNRDDIIGFRLVFVPQFTL